MIEHAFPPEMMYEREKQLTLALLDCSGVYYDVNFTRDRILGTPIQIVDGVEYPILEQIGKQKGCTYSEILEYWALRMPPEEVEPFLDFSIIENIKARYAAGERLISHRFWTQDVCGNRMLAEQKIRLYEDLTTHDLLGLVYVSNIAENELLRQKESKLTARYEKEHGRLDFLTTLSTNIPGGYHRCGTGEGFPLEFVSDSFVETVGWTREELREKWDNKFLNLVAPEDRDFFLSHEEPLVRDGRVSLAYRIVRPDGTRRWVQDATLRVEKDGHEYYQCILADITDFVKRQEELSRKNLELMRQQMLLETIEKTLPGGYHRCADAPGFPFLYFGSSFEEITGWTREEIENEMDNLFINIVLPEDIPVCTGIITDVKTHGYSNALYRIKKKGGGHIWISDTTTRAEVDGESFYHGVLADVTVQLEELERAKKAAEESNLAKSTFLFNASHDIRTPMNAIQGFAHIIEQNADNTELVLETVRKLQRSGEVLLTLMNDVLELSRIERGKEVVNNQPIDLLAQANKLYEMMADEIEHHGITFCMENSIAHPMVLGDELKISRIAMNLLSNAKKFTPAGGNITFGIAEEWCDGQTARYTFFVRDSGIGMSQEFQKRAFEQFERERSSTVSGVSGSGLGLSIIKKLVDLLGGECKLESELGHGTTVTCSIPFELTDEEDLHPEVLPTNVSFSGQRLLLVEDNDFNREIAHYVFESIGFLVEEVQNGVECLEKLSSVPSGYYNFILMDLQMPLMDGYTATKEIRNHSDPTIAQIPIIAMTANAFDEDRRRCMEAGMNGHISKPLVPEEVLKELLRVLK